MVDLMRIKGRSRKRKKRRNSLKNDHKISPILIPIHIEYPSLSIHL